MELHEQFNILLHILFLLGILSGLFWVIISKEMQSLTTEELGDGVTATVKNLTTQLQTGEAPYPLACNYINDNKEAIKNHIDTSLAELKKKADEQKSHNDSLFRSNMIVLGVVAILTVVMGIRLHYYNTRRDTVAPLAPLAPLAQGGGARGRWRKLWPRLAKSKSKPEKTPSETAREEATKEYYTPLQILKLNIILFIGVGACEFIFFKNIASKYAPINSTDATESVLTAIIEQANANTTGSGTSTDNT